MMMEETILSYEVEAVSRRRPFLLIWSITSVVHSLLLLVDFGKSPRPPSGTRTARYRSRTCQLYMLRSEAMGPFLPRPIL